MYLHRIQQSSKTKKNKKQNKIKQKKNSVPINFPMQRLTVDGPTPVTHTKMLIFKPFEFRKFLNGLCPCQIIPQTSAVANCTLAQLGVRHLTRQFHTFTLVSKTMKHCWVTVIHLTRWLLPCKQSNTLLPETLAYTWNDKWTKNKVPKRKVNTVETQQHKICSDVTDWSTDASHWPTSSNGTLAPLSN